MVIHDYTNIAPTTDYVGFVKPGVSNNEVFKNLGLVNVNIEGQNYVGGIFAFYSDRNWLIQNCFVTGTIKGVSSVGGLMSRTDTDDMVGSYFVGTVSATAGTVGGLVAMAHSGSSITDSYVIGDISCVLM